MAHAQGGVRMAKAGKQLADNMTLFEHNVHKEATIHLAPA